MTTHTIARLLSASAAASLMIGVIPQAASAATVTHCPAASLRVSVSDGGAGLSHHGYLLVFTNVSARTCALTGYPHVFLTDAAGKAVTGAQRTLSGYLGGVRSRPTTVRLLPKKAASALLEGLAIRRDGSGCPARGLRVTAPQTFTVTVVRAGVDICTGVQVHPVVLGVPVR